MNTVRPITLTLAALGGQGGGVVTSWLVDVARREGYRVQATSVPGVAQRTGATIYYLEFFDGAAAAEVPIMALMPSPGLSDIVVAAELAEAARMVSRGIVNPEQTTLITSSHRVYTIGEKSELGDGRMDSAELLAVAEQHAQRLVTLDMAALAERHGSVISAAILGAIAGAGVLPFADESYRAAIRAEGKGVEASLQTFESARAAAVQDKAPDRADPERACVQPPPALTARIDEFPAAVHPTLVTGVERLLDYQDEDYALEYLSRLRPLLANDARGALIDAVARGLALWMSFEDTLRVAQLKVRPARLARMRREAQLKPGEVMRVAEFLKPRVEEICGTLPRPIGRTILASPRLRRLLGLFTGGRQVKVTNISGYLLLRGLAAARRFRRYTLRFADEREAMQRWLQVVQQCAGDNYDLACELADCQQLVAGYGETHARGRQRFEAILATAPRWVKRDDAAQRLRALKTVALLDENEEEFRAALSEAA